MLFGTVVRSGEKDGRQKRGSPGAPARARFRRYFRGTNRPQVLRLSGSPGWALLCLWLCASGGLLFPGPTAASIANLYGFGARAAGMAGAFTAVADDFSAVFYNPAGLMTQRQPLKYMNRGSFRIENGLQFASPHLYVQEAGGARIEDASLDLFSTFTLGITLEPFDLAGLLPRKCLTFGIGIASPIEYGFWWEREYPRDRTFVFHHDYNQHLMIIPAFAAEPVRGLCLGVGVNVTIDSVADTYGQVIVALDQLQQDGGSVLGRVDISSKNNQLGQFASIKARMSPIGGILYHSPGDRLRLGVTYRGELFFEDSGTNDIVLKIRVREDDPDLFPLGLFFPSRFVRYYSPEEVAAGLAFRPLPSVLVSVDLTWSRWSGYQPQITTPVSFRLFTVKPDFHDTLVPRAGCAVEISPEFSALAGYNYQESPVPNHPGYVTYVDTDRHVFSLGMEYALRGYRLQGYFQYHWAVRRDFFKSPGYGPDFAAGGDIFGFGLNLSAAF